MLTRRDLFSASLGVVPLAAGISTPMGAMAGGEAPVEIWEGWADVVLLGKPVRARRILMWVREGRDRSGGVAPFFMVPAGRPVIGHAEGALVIEKPRRVIFPLFPYDEERGVVAGEEDHPTTLAERFDAVATAVRENGFDCSPGFEGGYPLWITQDGPGFKHKLHAMSVTPYELTVADMVLMLPVRLTKAVVQSGV